MTRRLIRKGNCTVYVPDDTEVFIREEDGSVFGGAAAKDHRKPLSVRKKTAEDLYWEKVAGEDDIGMRPGGQKNS